MDHVYEVKFKAIVNNDKDAEDFTKAITHHMEYLIDFDGWPELSVREAEIKEVFE